MNGVPAAILGAGFRSYFCTVFALFSFVFLRVPSWLVRFLALRGK
jgi:hypothetical protein